MDNKVFNYNWYTVQTWRFFFSDKICGEYQNTHFIFHKCFRKSCRLWENVEKCSRAGQPTDDNIALAFHILYTYGYRHTLRTCNMLWGYVPTWNFATFCNQNSIFSCVKGKVKWSRYRPDLAQRVGRGIALLFHDRGTRRGWVVSSTFRPHSTTV